MCHFCADHGQHPFLKIMLIFEHPHFGGYVIHCHFTLSKEHQMALNIILTWDNQLLVHVAHNISDQSCLVCLHSWQEMTLAEFNNIGSVMSVKVQTLLVVGVFETLLVKPSLSSWQ